jgi:hypothetical protein
MQPALSYASCVSKDGAFSMSTAVGGGYGIAEGMRKLPANASRDQGGRFRRGHSGNPAGKPKGTRHRATLAVQAILDNEAKALTRNAIELAKAGDTSGKPPAFASISGTARHATVLPI